MARLRIVKIAKTKGPKKSPSVTSRRALTILLTYFTNHYGCYAKLSIRIGKALIHFKGNMKFPVFQNLWFCMKISIKSHIELFSLRLSIKIIKKFKKCQANPI